MILHLQGLVFFRMPHAQGEAAARINLEKTLHEAPGAKEAPILRVLWHNWKLLFLPGLGVSISWQILLLVGFGASLGQGKGINSGSSFVGVLRS